MSFGVNDGELKLLSARNSCIGSETKINVQERKSGSIIYSHHLTFFLPNELSSKNAESICEL